MSSGSGAGGGKHLLQVLGGGGVGCASVAKTGGGGVLTQSPSKSGLGLTFAAVRSIGVLDQPPGELLAARWKVYVMGV